ncbi:MAG: DUF547 domain-containing protein [Nevskiales bacterium]
MFSLSALAAPKAELWERWTTHDAKSRATIDHKTWDGLLKKYITPAESDLNRFGYGAVSPADKRLLELYLTALQRTEIDRYNRNEQRAFWINLYNAATIKVVLDHYPVASIRDIKLGKKSVFGGGGPWSSKFLKVQDQDLSLDEIEHRILRPIWKDALIHYTVNCASVGCPNLADQAYAANNFKALAETGARSYINSLRGARVAKGKLYVSSIYVWFKSDFGGTDAAVLKHLRQYAKPALMKELEGITRIGGDQYDWSLNAAK